jgi:hypothetical protein
MNKSLKITVYSSLKPYELKQCISNKMMSDTATSIVSDLTLSAIKALIFHTRSQHSNHDTTERYVLYTGQLLVCSLYTGQLLVCSLYTGQLLVCYLYTGQSLVCLVYTAGQLSMLSVYRTVIIIQDSY